MDTAINPPNRPKEAKSLAPFLALFRVFRWEGHSTMELLPGRQTWGTIRRRNALKKRKIQQNSHLNLFFFASFVAHLLSSNSGFSFWA
jgi:hypothetical protein